VTGWQVILCMSGSFLTGAFVVMAYSWLVHARACDALWKEQHELNDIFQKGIEKRKIRLN
jgi:hypothetical protein